MTQQRPWRNAELSFASLSVRRYREKKPLFLPRRRDFHPGGCTHYQHGHRRWKTQPTWLNKDCIPSAMFSWGFGALTRELMSPFCNICQTKPDSVLRNPRHGIRSEPNIFGVWRPRGLNNVMAPLFSNGSFRCHRHEEVAPARGDVTVASL